MKKLLILVRPQKLIFKTISKILPNIPLVFFSYKIIGARHLLFLVLLLSSNIVFHLVACPLPTGPIRKGQVHSNYGEWVHDQAITAKGQKGHFTTV